MKLEQMGSHDGKYYTGSTTNTIDQDNLQMALRLKNEILYKTLEGHPGELFITLEYEYGRFYYDSKFRRKRRGKEGRPNKQSMGKKSTARIMDKG